MFSPCFDALIVFRADALEGILRAGRTGTRTAWDDSARMCQLEWTPTMALPFRWKGDVVVRRRRVLVTPDVAVCIQSQSGLEVN